jgi:hypothetical protein
VAFEQDYGDLRYPSSGDKEAENMHTRTIACYSQVLLIVLLAALACSPATADWRQLAEPAPWVPRTDFAAVAFDGRIWVLGGSGWDCGSPKLFNDVWYSTDGVDWTLATADAGWSPRSLHLCLAFHGKLWLFGAPDLGTANDMWYSADGAVWTRVEDAPPWFPRWAFSAVVFDEKIWVIGGQDPHAYRSDVWCSSDGINWTQVTPSASWAARRDHISLVHDGKIWVMGGNACIDWEGPYFNDVWHSPDGVNWTQAGDAPYWLGDPRQKTSVAYGGRIWLISSYISRVPWYTEDGATWTGGTDALPWFTSPGAERALSYASEMWIITGGNSGKYTGHYNCVWHSSDVVNWVGTDKPAAFGGRAEHASVAHDGKLWVLAGRWSSAGDILNDVWSSPDGADWTQATNAAPWTPRVGHASVAFNGSIWVLGGGTFDGQYVVQANDVWYSTDGAQWTAATSAAPWVAREGHASVVHQGMLWVLGGRYYELGGDFYYDGTNYYLSDAWQSTDGHTWTEVASAAPWGPRAYFGCVPHDGKIWVAGGDLQADGSMNTMNDVWYSADGTNWVQATEHAPWSPRCGHTMTVFDGNMWVLGGLQHGLQDAVGAVQYLNDRWLNFYEYEYFNDAWYSSDGVNWTQAAGSAAWCPRGTHTALASGGKVWIIGGHDTRLCFKEIWYAEDPRAFAFTTAPTGGWKEEGEGLTLSVGIQGAAGSVTYQWMKDDGALDGQTSSVLTIPSLELSDQGYYWCIVTDESEAKTAHESPRAYVQVFPAGSLSGTSLPFIALAIVATIVVGALVVRHKRSHAEPPSTSQHK